MIRTMMVVVAFGLLIAMPPGAPANDEPDSLVGCRFITIRPGKANGVGGRLRFKCQGTPDLPDEPGNDPQLEGGKLRVFDLGGNGGDDTYDLPAGNWTRIPQNTMSPLRGFRYRADVTPTLPCKSVIVRDNVVRATCKDQAMTLTPPFSGDAAIVLTVGTDSKRYCARLGGANPFNRRVFWARNSPPPTECSSPSGAFLEASPALF